MSEIMKIIDERGTQNLKKKKKKIQTKTEICKGVAQVKVNVWELKSFVARLT